MTETPLQLILEANVKKGHEKKLHDLAKSGPSKVERSEPGTLEYRWVINDAGTSVRFLDTYATPQAFVEHFQAGKSSGLLDEMMACVDITAAQVIGKPNPEAKKILDGFGATYFHEIGGFNRMDPHAAVSPSL